METILKINLYVDGNYCWHIFNYLQTGIESNLRSTIRWDKFLDYITHFVQEQEQKRCAIVQKRYFIGTGAEYDAKRQNFYNDLEYAGIQRVAFPLRQSVKENGKLMLKEQATDTLLTYTAAKDFYSVPKDDRNDYLVLVAGDSDFYPLTNGLKTEGVKIIIVYFDYTSPLETTRAAQALLDSADFVISLEALLKNRVDENAKAIFSRIESKELAHQDTLPTNLSFTPHANVATHTSGVSFLQFQQAIELCTPDAEGYVLAAKLGKALETVLGQKIPHGFRFKDILKAYSPYLDVQDTPALRMRVKKSIAQGGSL